MSTRHKRSPPLVTFAREALARIVRLSAADDVEQWGFVIGRWTRGSPRCYRVTRAVIGPTTRRTRSTVSIDVKKAIKMEARLRRSPDGNVPVGSWHSHPENARTAAALVPQISAADKKSLADGALEVICATYPACLPSVLRGNKFLLAREVGGKACRVEAWLRRGSRFLPCEVKVR